MATILQSNIPPPKQIRFVNNQGQPPSKRRRINAACLTCRKRKTRCAGERPVCSTCEKNGHVCLGYADIAEKRKDDDDTADSPRDGNAASGNTRSRSGGSASSAVKHEAAHETAEPGSEFLADATPRGRFANSTSSQARNKQVDDDDDDDNDTYDDDTDTVDNDPRRGSKSSAGSLMRGSQLNVGLGPTTSPICIDSVSPTPGTVQRPTTAHTRTGSQGNHRHSFQNDGKSPPMLPRPNSSVEDTRKNNSRSPPQIQRHVASNRVPYFRYFGPTAIVPGFKQMVVDVSIRDKHRPRGTSFSSTSPHPVTADGAPNYDGHTMRNEFKQIHEPVFESRDDLPVYDPNDPAPVHPLILSLLKTFFVHLGCNYPFLHEDRVLRMVREKRMEPILVDAMCALASRFSDHPAITNGNDEESTLRSSYGNVFAQRAKAATVDTFPCPSVAAVQACLLMAYEGFGANQDSALWMYLGLAIRMAVDLGLQKRVGVRYQGEKDPWYTRIWHKNPAGDDEGNDGDMDETMHVSGQSAPESDQDETLGPEEQQAVEQERVDTFWSVFVLDRIISSGTGRPVTFRDDDYELELPEQSMDPTAECPDPFPTLVRIIHLYGRVSDVLNNIHNVEDLTREKMKRLAEMENDLTQLYQKQDHRLNFSVNNFQQYVRLGQGTTFILMHFWFHAMVIVLHQPTLLAPFGSLSSLHQLLPNSHELSMSSAKTIADILAFAELIDPKSFVGNPFTSQPMYIAACAFLTESIANASVPVSRDTTPPSSERMGGRPPRLTATSKHSLLASNATQNYHCCYKSLQQLLTYWGGTRYILTALDQKAKGIWDVETYTSEEYESTKPPRRNSFRQIPRFEHPASPNAPPIAWSLTGTTNSSNPSLTLLFQSHANNTSLEPSGQRQSRQQKQQKQSRRQGGEFVRLQTAHPQTVPPPPPPPQQHAHHQHTQRARHQREQHQRTTESPRSVSAATPPGNMIYDPIRQSIPEVPAMFPPAYPQATMSAVRYSPYPEQQPQPQLGDIDMTSPRSDGQASSISGLVYQNQNQGQTTPNHSNAQSHYHGHHHHGQDHRQHHQQQQHANTDSDMTQSHGQSQSQTLPGPVQSYNTPSSHHSSSYDTPIITGASPSNSGIGEPSGHQQTANVGMLDHSGGSGVYQSDFVQGGFSSNSFSYFGNGPITDFITFDSQEIDISSFNLPNDMMPQFFEYLPENIIDLFDGNVNGDNQ